MIINCKILWAITTILYLSYVVSCSHFRGATVWWKPVDASNFNGEIEINHRTTWTRSYSARTNCSTADIGTTRSFGFVQYSIALNCRVGCSGTLTSLDFNCTDLDVDEDWTSGERSVIHDIGTSVTYFEASSRPSNEHWIGLQAGRSLWEFRVKGNLSLRSDNGRINSSPVTTMTPVKLQRTCSYNIRLPVHDADKDIIRCRWAEGNRSECGEVCNGVPGAVLDQNACILSWAPNTDGWYAAAIQIEDFISPSSTTPMSSVPLQFLINVFNSSLPCTENVHPTLESGETPPDGSLIRVPIGATYAACIVASSGSSFFSITHFKTSSPFGLRTSSVVQSQLNSTLYYVIVSWTPTNDQDGVHLYCVRAVSSNGLESTQWCIALLVEGYVLESSGNKYSVGFTTIYRTHQQATLQLIVTTSESIPVTFTVTAANYSFTDTATQNDVTTVTLPYTLQVFSTDERDKGIYVKATEGRKITVYGLSYHHTGYSTDAFLALPCNINLEQSEYTYYGLTYYYHPTHPTQLLIVACEDNTTVSTNSTTFTLNHLQTYVIESRGDLTGMKVTTDKPVSFFGNSQCSRVGSVGYCDHITEQLPPTTTWGRKFLVSSLMGNPYVGDLVRMVASQNSTFINITCNNTRNETERYYMYLGTAGDWNEFTIFRDKYCSIETSAPILLVQIAAGDSFTIIIPAVEQYTNNFRINSFQQYSNYLTLYIPPKHYQPAQIYVDDAQQNNQTWIHVPCANDSICGYITRIAVNPGFHHIYHLTPQAKLSVSVYGFARDVSYGYPGGLGGDFQYVKNLSVRLSEIRCDTQTSTLTCSFAGVFSNSNWNIDWRRNGDLVPIDGVNYEQTWVDVGVGITEDRLTILNSNNFHGNFTCTVREATRQTTSNSAFLLIDLPTISVLQAENANVPEGGCINITCTVIGHLQPTITWLATHVSTNNSLEIVNSTSRVSVTAIPENIVEGQETDTESCNKTYILTSMLLIENVTQEDGVTYVCLTDYGVSRNVTINVTSLTFTSRLYEAQVLETFREGGYELPPDGFLQVACIDNVTGLPIDTVEYSMYGDHYGAFEINSTSGQFSLTRGQILDYETAQMYSFNVTCTSTINTDLNATATVSITILPVNEFRPVLSTSTINVTVSEDTLVGTTILSPQLGGLRQYSVTDRDTGPDGVITYSLEVNETEFAHHFHIDSDNGSLTLEQGFDVDNTTTGTVYLENVVQIFVCDGQRPREDCPVIQVSVTVVSANDNDPEFSSEQYEVCVLESSPVGTTIAMIECTDADVGAGEYQGIQFALDSRDMFYIQDERNGIVILGGSLDFETNPIHNLTLICHDTGGRRDTAYLIINVLQVNETEIITIVENDIISIDCAVSTAGVVQPNFTWLKAQLSINYSFSVLMPTSRVNVITQEEESNIETNTGRQCYNTTVTSTLMIRNAETGDGGSYVCRADGVVIRNVTIIINKLTFSSPLYEVQVPETYTEGGYELPADGFLQVACVDNMTRMLIDSVEYSIYSGNYGPFEINSTNGNISIIDGQILDYELEQSYIFTVMCISTSNSDINATATVNITILPVNEFRPVFSTNTITVTVSEDIPVGTTLLSPQPGGLRRYLVTDEDKGPDGVITYSLEVNQTEFARHFLIDSDSGSLTLKQGFDVDNATTGTIYLENVVQIFACDGQRPQEDCPVIQVSVTVESANDNNPVFLFEQYEACVQESSPVGTTIVILDSECTDMDVGAGELEGIVVESNNAVFNISDERNGIVILGGSLDFEANPVHNLTLICRDTGGRTATAYLRVNVLQVNDTEETITIVENNIININCTVSTVGVERPTITWLKTQLSTNNSFSVLMSTSRMSITTQEDTRNFIETNTGRQCNNINITVTSRLIIQNAEPGDGGTYLCQSDGVVVRNITINITTINNCTLTSCKNGGQCIDLFQDFRCNCTGTNATGRQCEHRIVSLDPNSRPGTPNITAPIEPQSLMPVNLTCEANDSIALTYRWFRDGVVIEGEVNSYIYIPEFVPEDRGYYTCEAINDIGRESDQSDSSLLTLQDIRQYSIKLNNSQFQNQTGAQDLTTQINSILRRPDGFGINVELYEISQQNITYSKDRTMVVISVIITLNVSNATTTNGEEIQEAIKLKLLQSLTLFSAIQIASVSVVRYDGCPAIFDETIESFVFNWNETEIGSNASYPCPCRRILRLDEEGMERSISRKCGGTYRYGAEWEPVDIIEACGLSNITLELCHALLANNSEVLSQTLVGSTSNTDEIQAVDISAATTLIEGLETDTTSLRDENITRNILRTIDNLIQADRTQIVQSQNTSRTSSRLLGILTNFSDNVQVTNTTNFTFVQHSYAIYVANFDSNDFDGETLAINLGTVDEATSREIPSSAISTTSGISNTTALGALTAEVRIPSSIFKELGLNDSHVYRLSYAVFTQGALFQSLDENQTNLTLGSVVVSVRINGTSKNLELTNPIEVLFQASIQALQYPDISCGIWNPDGVGSWLLNTCEIVDEDENSQKEESANEMERNTEINNDKKKNNDKCKPPVYMVQYRKPRHFGLLLDLTHGLVEPPSTTFALEVITYIALPISLFCLLIFIVTYISSKQLRSTGHGQILINISVVLTCLYVIFLIGGHAAPVPPACGISAALLQYFMLVYFLWTAIEALYLYRKLVKVLGTHIPKFVLYLGLIAWLVPWIVVILSVGPGHKSYYRSVVEVSTCNNTSSINTVNNKPSGFCRAVGVPFWVGTVLPFAITYIFNWVVFILILVSLTRRRYTKEILSMKYNKLKFIKQQLTIAFGLATLFGLGWGFGLAATGTSVHNLTLAFQIIFSLFVGSQGVLFFVLHGLKEQEARKQWKLWFSKISRLGKKSAKDVPRATNLTSNLMSTLPRDSTFPRKEKKALDLKKITKTLNEEKAESNKTKDINTAGENLIWENILEDDYIDPELEYMYGDDLVVTNIDMVDDDDDNGDDTHTTVTRFGSYFYSTDPDIIQTEI